MLADGAAWPSEPEPEARGPDFAAEKLTSVLSGQEFVAQALWHETRAGLGP